MNERIEMKRKEESHFRKCKMIERKKMMENSKFIENKK